MYMTKDMFESTPADLSVKDPKVRVNVNGLQSRYNLTKCWQHLSKEITRMYI